jgi:hypothetical protein
LQQWIADISARFAELSATWILELAYLRNPLKGETVMEEMRLCAEELVKSLCEETRGLLQ